MQIRIAATLLLAAACAAQQPQRDFDFPAADGARLKATYYSPGKPGPGILLLHQCNMNRQSWNALATALAERGVHVLTFDYRGYGDTLASGGRQNLEPDIDSAMVTLAAQPGVDKNRLAAGGASCGVNNAVQLARRSGQVKALLLLSGPTSTDGLKYLEAHPALPIFAAASSEEGLAVSSLTAVVASSKNPASLMRVLDRAGHGAPMFDAAPALLPAVLDWVVKVLS